MGDIFSSHFSICTAMAVHTLAVHILKFSAGGHHGVARFVNTDLDFYNFVATQTS